MSGGFALVGRPAQYDITGVMTFIVNHDGIVYQKDLGPETESVAWHLRVNPWIHRGAVGIRFQWLGSGE